MRQYTVEADPERLRAFDLTLGDVYTAVGRANVDVGGRVLEIAETEVMVRGYGRLADVADLESVPVGPGAGHVPVLLSQVARVTVGPAPRRGLTELNGEGEVVSGIVVMRTGRQPREVIDRVEARLGELAPSLPAGVEIHRMYDLLPSDRRGGGGAVDQARRRDAGGGARDPAVLPPPAIRGGGRRHLALGVLASFVLMALLGLETNVMSLGASRWRSA